MIWEIGINFLDLPNNCMNSLEFIDGEACAQIIPLSPSQNIPPSYLFDNPFNSGKSKQKDYQENNLEPRNVPEFNSILQQKIGLMNQAGLQEIREVSTVHEKSCSTSKILPSNFQSKVMNNSFMNGSTSKLCFLFLNKRFDGTF